MNRQQIGKKAEQLTCIYLQQQGLQLQAQNFYSRYGEIDLIMCHGDTLCFIEVRARHTSAYGGAVDTVNQRKQYKIIQTAQVYLQTYPVYEDLSARFDVVALDYDDTQIWQKNFQQQLQQITIDWIQDAYTL